MKYKTIAQGYITKLRANDGIRANSCFISSNGETTDIDRLIDNDKINLEELLDQKVIISMKILKPTRRKRGGSK